MIIFVDPLYAFSESVYSFVEQDGIEDLTLLITNGVVFQSGRTVMRVVTVTTADGTATGINNPELRVVVAMGCPPC